MRAQALFDFCKLDGPSILKANEDLAQVCTKTDVRKLVWLEKILGICAFGKFENQQKTGSFKFRGAYNRLRQQKKGRGIIAASAGNHALGIAEAAHLLGVDTTICIPTTASSSKKHRLAAYQHAIVQQGSSLEEATEYAKALAEKYQIDFVSPYNDFHVIQGQGTIAVEFLQQVPDLDVLVVPVGGGGLVCGIGVVAKYLNPSIRIVAVGPEKYASFYASLHADVATRVVHYPTMADGLAVNLESESLTIGIGKQVVDEVILVDEDEIAAATLSVLYHESQLIEPSGAVGLAALISGKLSIPSGAKVGLVFTGGNVPTSMISQILHYPFKNSKLLDFINVRGTRLCFQDSFQGIHYSSQQSLATSMSQCQQDDLLEDRLYFESRFDSVKGLVHKTRHYLSEYITYCASENLQVDQSAVMMVESLLGECEKVLNETFVDLTKDLSPEEYSIRTTKYFQIYRTLLHMVLSSTSALDWRSASYGQSMHTMFFGLHSQKNPGVNYNRYESNQLISVERQLADVFELDQRKSNLYLASSGMAAYTLLESYVLRFVLQPGDTVLIPQYIYFESDEQISKLPHINVVRADTHDPNEIIQLIRKHSPKVVFIDPLTNTPELRMTDIPAFFNLLLKEELEKDIYVVIDGTTLSAQINPSHYMEEKSRVKVLYYDSCSKYLQLGLDIAMGGLVIIPAEFGAIFDRMRRNTGTILYDLAANIFPVYSREIHQNRMKRFTRNALIVGNRLLKDAELADQIHVTFPLLEHHPDYSVAKKFDSVGGLMTFMFKDDRLNHRDSLNSFIDTALSVAKDRRASLTKGVSFGFSIPRISAASAMAEDSPPFLRLSVGDRSYNETQLLAEVLAESFKQYLHSTRAVGG